MDYCTRIERGICMNDKSVEVVGSLLTVGDEILLGDISNGNAHHIASQLRARGFRLNRIITVGDRENEIVEMLADCLQKCHYIIVTGGLGPTDDDRTSAAVSRAFQRPLVLNTDYMEWLKVHLARYGVEWSDKVSRMAYLPEGAVKLGLEMAGFFIEHRGTPCYFLPGVPHEMRYLLDSMVIPDLAGRFPCRLVYHKHVMRVQGLMESELNHLLKDLSILLMDDGIEIGYLPQVGENWVTLFAAAASREELLLRVGEAERKIIAKLGAEHISGYNDECLEMIIGRLLRKRDWKLAVAESCTGGLLSKKITSISGASDYFDRAFITYSNKAKTELLDVPEALLERHGAVSEPVARAMAEGAQRRAGVQIALSTTEVAGPTGGSPEKPVGTVFIACTTPRGTVVQKHFFGGSRDYVQECAAQAALVLLWRILSDDSHIHSH